jgi:hypothetical protein
VDKLHGGFILTYCSPELLADPGRDQSPYALDPLQVPQFMVGPVLVAWLMSESGNVVGMVMEDHIGSDELQVLRVPLSLTAVSAQTLIGLTFLLISIDRS